MVKLEIGQTVYWFNFNNRVYVKNEHGMPTGSPITEHYFRPEKVVGEDKRKYLLGGSFGTYVNKATGEMRAGREVLGVCYTEQMKQDYLWDKEHRCNIRNIVDKLDVDKLRKVADVIGYVSFHYLYKS